MRRYLPGLDALRGVAAFAVLLLHGSYKFHLPHLLRHGYLAVDFFFMMSGFVLAHAYEERLRAGLTVGAFMQARFTRLYPMVVLGVATGMVAASVESHAWQKTAVDSVTGLALMPHLFGTKPSADVFPIDPPLWSLFWELLAGAMLATVLYKSSTRKLSVCCATCFIALTYLTYRHGSTEIGYTVDHFTDGAARVGFAFTAGMILFRWWLTRPFSVPSLPTGVIATVLVAVFAIPDLSQIWFFDLLAIAVGFPLIILSGVGAGQTSAFWRAGADMSYPLYLLHIPILTLCVALCAAQSMIARSICMMVGVAVAILCSFAAHRIWDQPLRRWLSASLRSNGGRITLHGRPDFEHATGSGYGVGTSRTS